MSQRGDRVYAITMYLGHLVCNGLVANLAPVLSPSLRREVKEPSDLLLGLLFLLPSIWLEVKGLSELLLLLRHFSDILIFWKIFKVNEAQILTFWALNCQYLNYSLLSVDELVCSLSHQSFCVEIVDPEVVLGQYLKPMTCQVEAEWDCYMTTI